MVTANQEKVDPGKLNKNIWCNLDFELLVKLRSLTYKIFMAFILPNASRALGKLILSLEG